MILEVLYRGYLRLEYPTRFQDPPVDQVFTTWDKPMWRYSARFGYAYIPEEEVTQTTVQAGHVVGCTTVDYVNQQGNIGPSVPDYAIAQYKILVFGDSFSASMLNGETWPSVLQTKLSATTKVKVRVLNLARDGYGVLQIFDLAAAKIPELKPDLVIFAFNSQALTRDRSWRVLVGHGEDVRLVTTTEASSDPEPSLSTDFAFVVPAATQEWCAAMLRRSLQAQRDDPVLVSLLRKRRYIEGQDRRTAVADLYDPKASYVYDRLIHHDPFFAQWRKLQPSIVPMVSFSDYRADPRLVHDVAAVQQTGIPYLIVHLPMGISLRDHQEFWFEGNAELLLKSLESVTAKRVQRLGPYLNIAPNDAMKLCLSAVDCHPSEFGMQEYAGAVAQIVRPFLDGLVAR